MSDVARLLARPDVRALLAAFAEAGAPARIVGGAVRDAVMGRPPGDIDLATPMLPDAVMTLARAKGWRAVPTGIDHGTVTLVLEGRPYEVTTLRRDVETDGRRAVVAFTRDWREDAFRRDFTLNALSLAADGTVHDHATGVADAKAGIIRFMGDPETRIREDYLRILRFFRFMASHGDLRGSGPEPEGLAACARLKAGLDAISRERVRQELLKLLVAPGAVAAARTMESIGLWPHVLPAVTIDLAAFRRWTSLGGVLPEGQDPVSALAALTCGADEPAAIAAGLRLSRREGELLSLARSRGGLAVMALTTPGLGREAVYRIGPAALPAVLRAGAAAAGLEPDKVRHGWSAMQPILARPPSNPFRSADAAALGVEPGPRMGAVLRDAEAAWIAAGLPDAPAQAKRLLATAARRN
jgi:poly(A) polymerase